jgi:hypothetical protein
VLAQSALTVFSSLFIAVFLLCLLLEEKSFCVLRFWAFSEKKKKVASFYVIARIYNVRKRIDEGKPAAFALVIASLEFDADQNFGRPGAGRVWEFDAETSIAPLEI